MPNYEFTCQDCQHKFSKLSSSDKKSEIICPNCNSKNLKENYENCFSKKVVKSLRDLNKLSKSGFG
ncbi:FmdB family zinc ribbon protein [Natranaerobius thermophilus]|uniref:Putative regulatory protein FmdB zinc ribbon domain-containing protein n=1 Tax=Natranaerobius thermophilus (strain ATCC BAA-1301 / DSM 18059 / JW/NM-WN-LF) TaxID=457570 RepID=B2A6S8_NATTJ|nr:zinc ribbon domain-containing protein [Natranaerobius thermophilus]ACB84209.1 hypothetical protein Nther_0614 [Natranaerobius thermophilus JW/NM-WN-LF]